MKKSYDLREAYRESWHRLSRKVLLEEHIMYTMDKLLTNCNIHATVSLFCITYPAATIRIKTSSSAFFT